MAVHSTEEVLSSLNQQMLGVNFLPHPIHKYKFPGPETNSAAAYQLVHDELLLDGNSRQNLATFCQTWVEPEVRKLMDECIDKNLIDKDEYRRGAFVPILLAHLHQSRPSRFTSAFFPKFPLRGTAHVHLSCTPFLLGEQVPSYPLTQPVVTEEIALWFRSVAGEGP
jgi:hypothetical protein